MTVVIAGFSLGTDLARAKFRPEEYFLVHRSSEGLTGIGETKMEVHRALALCWMWGAGKQRAFEVWPVSDGNLRAQMYTVLDTRARCCTVLTVTCYLSCFIAHTQSTVVPWFLWCCCTRQSYSPSAQPLVPRGQKDHSLFGRHHFNWTVWHWSPIQHLQKQKKLIHLRLMGKDFTTFAGVHLHHFWDKKIEHTQKLKHFR